MVKFCEGCPMSGTMDESHTGFISSPYKLEGYFGTPSYTGRAGALFDKNGGVSEIFDVNSNRLAETAIEGRITDCPGPETKTSRFRKNPRIIGCPALTALKIDSFLGESLRPSYIRDVAARTNPF